MDDLRQLAPATRFELPVWELTHDGQVIGWVCEKVIAHCTSHFFHSIGIDPDTDRVIDLEMSTDFDERVLSVRAFHIHPEQSVHRNMTFPLDSRLVRRLRFKF
ncbi:MAG: hypothetical protein JWO18_1734 [Microbacteriaceae bacterium]|nr:hypothetical protein [Microbacteriaceae bacterium]